MKWTDIWSRIGSQKIIIYADFIDPFCYIGFHQLRRVSRPPKTPLEWRGFELNPDTPMEGSHLVEVVHSDLRPTMWASVDGFAKKSGLTLSPPTFVPNTRLALLWVLGVPESDVKNSLIERIYQAYLSDKMDIGNVDILCGIAGEFKLPEAPLRTLDLKRDPAPLEKHRQEAIGHQFAGMPGYVFRGKTYFGALSVEAWNTIIEKETLRV